MLDVHEGADVVLDAEDGLPKNNILVISQRDTPPKKKSSEDLMSEYRPHSPSLHHLLEFHTHEKPSAHSLRPSDQFGQAVIAHFFQGSQQAGFEEHLRGEKAGVGPCLRRSTKDSRPAAVRTEAHLGVSEFVLRVVNVDGGQQLLTSFLAVDELSLWDRTRIQHAVSAIVDTEAIRDY